MQSEYFITKDWFGKTEKELHEIYGYSDAAYFVARIEDRNGKLYRCWIKQLDTDKEDGPEEMPINYQSYWVHCPPAIIAKLRMNGIIP